MALRHAMKHERLLEVLSYDKETGAFVWRIQKGKKAPGTTAGRTDPNGYRSICVDGQYYLAHRLAVFYVCGEWPVDQMDHINRDKQDNRWINLRQCTKTQNMSNRGMSSNNKSGLKGAYYNKKDRVWTSFIGINYKRLYLGSFATAQEAHEAYASATAHHFGEFSNNGEARA